MAVKEDLNSTMYRYLLEFMKQDGIQPVIDFYEDYQKLVNVYLVYDAIYEGKHPTLSLVQKHKDVVRFIRELKTHNYPSFLFDKKFLEFARRVTDENISRQIEGARALEELGVYEVRLGIDPENVHNCQIEYNVDDEIVTISKYYSNGNVSYVDNKGIWDTDWDRYIANFDFRDTTGNFIVGYDSSSSLGRRVNAEVSDFLFDTSLLPSREEISRLDIPDTLRDSKVFTKRIKY